MRLVESVIPTRGALAWRGVHLPHFASAACAQKPLAAVTGA